MNPSTDIASTREAVVYLYTRFPETIESDNTLLQKYQEVFAGELSANVIATITRHGRHLRALYPERYTRSASSQALHTQREQDFRDYFGRS